MFSKFKAADYDREKNEHSKEQRLTMAFPSQIPFKYSMQQNSTVDAHASQGIVLEHNEQTRDPPRQCANNQSRALTDSIQEVEIPPTMTTKSKFNDKIKSDGPAKSSNMCQIYPSIDSDVSCKKEGKSDNGERQESFEKLSPSHISRTLLKPKNNSFVVDTRSMRETHRRIEEAIESPINDGGELSVLDLVESSMDLKPTPQLPGATSSPELGNNRRPNIWSHKANTKVHGRSDFLSGHKQKIKSEQIKKIQGQGQEQTDNALNAKTTFRRVSQRARAISVWEKPVSDEAEKERDMSKTYTTDTITTPAAVVEIQNKRANDTHKDKKGEYAQSIGRNVQDEDENDTLDFEETPKPSQWGRRLGYRRGVRNVHNHVAPTGASPVLAVSLPYSTNVAPINSKSLNPGTYPTDFLRIPSPVQVNARSTTLNNNNENVEVNKLHFSPKTPISVGQHEISPTPPPPAMSTLELQESYRQRKQNRLEEQLATLPMEMLETDIATNDVSVHRKAEFKGPGTTSALQSGNVSAPPPGMLPSRIRNMKQSAVRHKVNFGMSKFIEFLL